MHPLETYIRELREIRSSGEAVPETSYYGALSSLLNEVGKSLKPRVRCIVNPRNRGAGIPDGGLFTPDQFQRHDKSQPIGGQIPSRGVIEIKPTCDDAFVTAEGKQVSRYWDRYGQVLVTSYRDFVMVGSDRQGRSTKLETYRLVPNLSQAASAYTSRMQTDERHLFNHIVAGLHAPAYRCENAGALRQDWPRVPLPDTKQALEASSELGRQVAALLDTENTVAGVTSGTIRVELKTLAVVSRIGGGTLDPDAGDLALTAGWGHAGKGGITMPGKGQLNERTYTPAELEAIAAGVKALGLSTEQALSHLGDTTFDVYLNDVACWRNVPARVWDYRIGGYQVIKKWLSYRERELLGRPLTPDEAREVMNIARRIAAILLLEPSLDANYESIKRSCYTWPSD